MQEFINNFHFIRPWWLLALLIPAVFYWRYFIGANSKSSWEAVCDKRLLDFLLVKGSSQQRRMIAYTALAAFLAAVIAIAGPSWKKKEVPTLMPENPVMFLLNLSTDMTEKDVTPNRLARAKYELTDLLQMLHGVQSGLIVYTSEPFLISPITDDRKLVENLLPALDYNIMPENGDRLDRAIGLAVEKLKNAGYPKGNIVIFSADVGQRVDLAMEAAKKAAAEGYKISVAAITKDNSEKLEMIARDGGGIFTDAARGNISKIAGEINNSANDELKLSENLRSTWEDYGYYLVAVPLLCCLYFFRRGILAIAFLLAFLPSAQAGFFLNNNQEGLKAFNAQDYQHAGQKFEDSRWKGSSYYRSGDYQKAYQEFSSESDATALYNQGNALAKGGKIEEAIKKYEEVLKMQPNHEDAKFNLEYLKKQQENQQNQQNQNNNQNNQDKQGQQQSGSDNNQPQNSDENQQQQGQSQSQQEENEQKKDNNQDNQNPEGQPNQQPQDSQDKDDRQDKGEQKQQQSRSEQQQESPTPNDKQEESAAAEPEKGDDQKQYDEKIQAQIQQYREIPEDTGGLLRAFIKKEYMRNRYKKRGDKQ